ncbi:MAG: hypothetical protein ACFFB2_18625 [Promethearchaeota archaeon]
MQLYLGVVPGIFPWLKEYSISKKMKEKQVGIIFSYWSFRKKEKEIISKGLHDYFSFEGSIIVDSGAYSAFNSGIKIQLQEYSSFLSNLGVQDDDIIVNLDVIGNPTKSSQNWLQLINKFNINILPVIHLPEKRNLYPSVDYIGLGGMVPAFKINQKGSVMDVISWLMYLMSRFPEKRYHGFGIGSPYHQIIFQDFLHSLDWIGWRRNAAFCSCYTPEGSVYIHEARRKKKRAKGLNSELFELYSPPFIESYEILHKPGSEGWIWRTLWNVWWFLVANDYENQIENSNYVRSLRKKIKQIRFELRTNKLTKFLQDDDKKNKNLL